MWPFNSKQRILDQMKERRPLPIGRKEFEAFVKRIRSACPFPVSEESVLFTLGGMILSAGPTESHKEDAYFIHALHKAAANETAHAIMQEAKEEHFRKKASSEKPVTSEVTPPSGVTIEKILPNTGV